MKIAARLIALLITASALSMLASPLCTADETYTRNVELTYSCTIEDIPEGAKVIDLWMPVASDSEAQSVTRTQILGPEGGAIAREPGYGNLVFHKRFAGPFTDESYGAELQYEIRKNEIVIPEAKIASSSIARSPMKEFEAYLSPNRLIPVDGRIETIAKELGLEDMAPMAVAHTIYKHLIEDMTYNWQAEGAGEGDVLWACDSKTGDCTDYSSLFIALCRSQGIPADHEFGFPIRSPRDKGRIPSYHCWVRFYIEGVGWVPVDTSEADKHPELHEYNFGSQEDNILKFSHGRDVVLTPPQQGPPLNLFIHPYVEIDGKPHKGLKYVVRFQNIAP